MAVREACLGLPLLDPLCQGAGAAGSSLVGSGATAILTAMASWVADGSTWLLHQIGSMLTSSTAVSLSAPWFLAQFRSMEGLLALVALPMLLISALQALAAQRPGLLVRAAFVQLPLAMMLAGGAVQLTQMGLALTDELCRSVSAAQPGALHGATSALAAALASSQASGSAVPSFITLVLAALAVLAGIVLWIELLLRSAAIYLCVLFIPLALACSIWPALSTTVRRLIEVLVSLIFSKLVVVVALCAAAGALGMAKGRDVATIMSGIALLVLACFAPFSLLKLLPIFESSAALHLEGLRQRATGTAARAITGRGVSMAVAAVQRSGGPGPEPSHLAAAGAPPMRPSGPRTNRSPMDFSAITASGPPGAPPIRRGSGGGPAPVPGPLEPRAPTQWPGGPQVPVRPMHHEPRTPPIRQRRSPPPPLVIERDHLGPLIRPRPSTPDE